MCTCKVKRKYNYLSDKTVVNFPMYNAGVLINGDTIYYPFENGTQTTIRYDGRFLTYKNGKLTKDVGILNNKYEGTCYLYDENGKLLSLSFFHLGKQTGIFIKYKTDGVEYFSDTNSDFHKQKRMIYFNSDMTIKKEEFYRNDSLIKVTEH